MPEKVRSEESFIFPMFHIASHFAHFQGISNPLFRIKYKEKLSDPEQIIIPLTFSVFFLNK